MNADHIPYQPFLQTQNSQQFLPCKTAVSHPYCFSCLSLSFILSLLRQKNKDFMQYSRCAYIKILSSKILSPVLFLAMPRVSQLFQRTVHDNAKIFPQLYLPVLASESRKCGLDFFPLDRLPYCYTLKFISHIPAAMGTSVPLISTL